MFQSSALKFSLTRASLYFRVQRETQARFLSKSKGNKTSAVIPVLSSNLLSIRKGNKVALIADGQTFQAGTSTILDEDKKVRRIGKDKSVLSGFIGATPEAQQLQTTIEDFVNENPGQLEKACIDFSALWREDKFLKRCEAHMILADKDVSLLVTDMGYGVFDSEGGIMAIGGGGSYVHAAAAALIDSPDLDAEEVALQTMSNTAEYCELVDTNCIHEVLEF
eukprot:CAMPEP_0204832398 /NCGR_PEP_ID=MMETSP1346-20131115/13534_1 /ASSEMBLY_ACC=CAM_ASM_000771 /TAXON_ID=215587 /ORGANISM="Aplanochytrium stocchinoi, Strain GSBS06" /LENGTH=221 /DNA_ID=CAMNT_0051964185 /DNA_START=45 /DNA_END=710 /DNA_ORIENTATION=-